MPVNADWDVIDAGLGGVTSLNLTGLSGIITLNTSQAQSLIIRLSGTQSGAVTVQTPASSGGFWIVDNESSGAVLFTTATGGSTGVSVPATHNVIINTDGINIESATDSYLPLAGGTMTGTLNCASNGLNVGSGQLVVTGGNITASGSITATGDITAFSDARRKGDIRTIEDALSKVLLMRGVTYYWKDYKENKRHAGVIAQEMREVFPEVVVEDYEFLSVAYGNLCSILIEAIKDLAYKVDALEADAAAARRRR